MNRRTERDFTLFSRRSMPRNIKMIIALIVAFLLFNIVLYLSTKYGFSPFKLTLTTETTTTTTTTTTVTTTLELETEKPPEVGCFFDKTNVTLADGSSRPLNLLTNDDEVLVYSSSGQIQKSRVLTVFHHQRSSIRFLDIYTTDNPEPLRLTPLHSILIKKNNDKSSSFHYDFASNIVVGDFVFSSELISTRVVSIKEIILYNQTISTPLTFEGNIIVNHLIASCYATYHHKFMHILTIPLRYWYQMDRFPRFNSLIYHFIDFYSKIHF